MTSCACENPRKGAQRATPTATGGAIDVENEKFAVTWMLLCFSYVYYKGDCFCICVDWGTVTDFIFGVTFTLLVV